MQEKGESKVENKNELMNKPIPGLDEIKTDVIKDHEIKTLESIIYKVFEAKTVEVLDEEEIELLKNPEKEMVEKFNAKMIMLYQAILKALGTSYVEIYNKAKEKEKEKDSENEQER